VMEVFEIVALPPKTIPSLPEVGFAVPVAAVVAALTRLPEIVLFRRTSVP
jgi:hypothetical protein